MFYNQDFILGEVVGLATDFRSNLLQHATTSQLQCRTCTCMVLIHLAVHVHVHVCVSLWTDNTIQYSSSLHLLCRTYTKCTRTIIHVHDIIRKERKKEERHLRQWKNEKWELPFKPMTHCTPDRCSTNWATKAAQLAGFESRFNQILGIRCTCTYMYVCVYMNCNVL